MAWATECVPKRGRNLDQDSYHRIELHWDVAESNCRFVALVRDVPERVGLQIRKCATIRWCKSYLFHSNSSTVARSSVTDDAFDLGHLAHGVRNSKLPGTMEGAMVRPLARAISAIPSRACS